MWHANVDPHAWMLTVPLTVGLLWAYFQPAEHAVKRVWRRAMQADLELMLWLTGRPPAADRGAILLPWSLLFWAAVVAFTATSAFSVVAYLGAG